MRFNTKLCAVLTLRAAAVVVGLRITYKGAKPGKASSSDQNGSVSKDCRWVTEEGSEGGGREFCKGEFCEHGSRDILPQLRALCFKSFNCGPEASSEINSSAMSPCVSRLQSNEACLRFCTALSVPSAPPAHIPPSSARAGLKLEASTLQPKGLKRPAQEAGS